MIVSLEHIWCQSTGGFVMKEVSTEEEAFAEMRKFLDLNNIPSDVTVVTMVEEGERFGRPLPRHKEVRMCQCGYIPPRIRDYPDPCFGIYYGTDRPKYEKLGSIEECGLTIEKNGLGDVVKDENGYPVLISNWYTKGNKWYIPLKIYLDDLEKRKEDDE